MSGVLALLLLVASPVPNMRVLFVGNSLTYFNDVPALHPSKVDVAYESGKLVMELLNKGVTPRSLVTRKSFENAITGVMSTGGSTNAVLHLLATAHDFGVELSLDDFDRISRKTPVIADMRPWGTYTAPEMFEAGGMPVVGKRLVEACHDFARQAGYRRVRLWTNHVLLAARGIYAKAGYRLVASEEHESFGHRLVGENWELDL